MLKLNLSECNDSQRRQNHIRDEISYHENVVEILTKMRDKKQEKINANRCYHYNTMMYDSDNTEKWVICRTKMDLLRQNLDEINRLIEVEKSYIEKNKYYLSNANAEHHYCCNE